jgi:hypothetical protein
VGAEEVGMGRHGCVLGIGEGGGWGGALFGQGRLCALGGVLPWCGAQAPQLQQGYRSVAVGRRVTSSLLLWPALHQSSPLLQHLKG